MELEIIEKTDEFKHVALKGRLNTMGVDQVEMRFNAVIGARSKQVLVDFSGVEFLSSMGIRMLISMARTVSANGGTVVILSPHELVLEAIQNASLDELIPVAQSLDEANALLGR